MMQHEPQLAVLEGVVVPVSSSERAVPHWMAAWLVGCGYKLHYGPTLASIRSPHAR